MRIVRLVLGCAACAAALAVPAAAATPSVKASVGPGFTISVAKKSLKAGNVKLVVRDLSPAHNFHLIGPGVNRKTTVAETGTKTWTVTLKRGTYRFVCDPHAFTMKGSFRVS